jgi:hypothetical protein
MGKHLLVQNDETIEYELFEEFDISIISFLHDKNLEKLLIEGFIDRETKNTTLTLRSKAFNLLNQEKNRSANFVRNSSQWDKVFELADGINELLKNNPKLWQDL